MPLVVTDEQASRLAANIRKARLAADVSQESLAEALGCHRVNVVQLESGDKRPSVDRLINIAEALGCEVADLVEGLP